MGKSKRGRRAQPGGRHPGGQLKAEPADAVLKWKRAKVLAEAQVIDPRWGSTIAQLVFFRRLTDREAAAADRWAKWIGRHDRIKGFPRRACASPQYEAGYGATADNVVTVTAGDEAFLGRFAQARKAAIGAGGIIGVMALDDAAALNTSVGSIARLDRMKAALQALLLHWGM
jgi:hypothetical protein